MLYFLISVCFPVFRPLIAMGILFLKNKPNIMKSYPTIVETGEILDADIPHDLRISYNQQWFPKIIHPKKKGGGTPEHKQI